MNIGIYSRTKNTSIHILEKALKERGHKSVLISNTNFEPTNPNNTNFPVIDLLYCWHGAGGLSSLGGRVSVCDFLRRKGIKIINEATIDDPLFVNKTYQLYKVTQNGVLAPQTITQIKPDFELISQKLGAPFILKASVGSSGKHVSLIDSPEKLEGIADKFSGRERLYQTLIRNDGDYRVHVIGGKSVCAYKRTLAAGEFRANVACGGEMINVEDGPLKDKLFIAAEKVVASFVGTEIMGIDLIQSLDDGEIYFIETNELPGIKQVREVTGVDIADKMVDHFESVVRA